MASKRNRNAPYWLETERIQREMIKGALKATGGNVTRSAAALGIERTYLTRVMRSFSIDRSQFIEESLPEVSP